MLHRAPPPRAGSQGVEGPSRRVGLRRLSVERRAAADPPPRRGELWKLQRRNRGPVMGHPGPTSSFQRPPSPHIPPFLTGPFSAGGRHGGARGTEPPGVVQPRDVYDVTPRLGRGRHEVTTRPERGTPDFFSRCRSPLNPCAQWGLLASYVK